jgi:hypothetical protein
MTAFWDIVLYSTINPEAYRLHISWPWEPEISQKNSFHYSKDKFVIKDSTFILFFKLLHCIKEAKQDWEPEHNQSLIELFKIT